MATVTSVTKTPASGQIKASDLNKAFLGRANTDQISIGGSPTRLMAPVNQRAATDEVSMSDFYGTPFDEFTIIAGYDPDVDSLGIEASGYDTGAYLTNIGSISGSNVFSLNSDFRLSTMLWDDELLDDYTLVAEYTGSPAANPPEDVGMIALYDETTLHHYGSTSTGDDALANPAYNSLTVGSNKRSWSWNHAETSPPWGTGTPTLTLLFY